MSKFKVGEKVKALAYRTDLETGEVEKRETTAKIVQVDAMGAYRLSDNNWYSENELMLATKYQEQKSKLNV